MKTFFNIIESSFSPFEWNDIIDILLVAYLFYAVIKFLRDTRAAALLKGITFFIVLSLISQWFEMKTISYLLENTMQVGLLALIIVFQPELRSVLERFGRSKLGKVNFFAQGADKHNEILKVVDAVCTSSDYMSRNKIGSLIVIEGTTKLGEIIKSGTILDAVISGELIVSTFFPNNPIHDGALIIRENRAYAAGCFLPLSQNFEISKQLGTRHRAALGLSEVSDSIIVVCSEESGKISVAYQGTLQTFEKQDMLKEFLVSHLIKESEEMISIFGSLFKKKGDKK